jgi:PKD repeat protein
MNRFSVIYEGYIIVEEAGDYTFYLTSDDGSYLWVDDIDDSDTPLIDNGGYHAPRERLSPPKYLDSGCHPVKVKMFENSGAAVLHLEWSSDEIARTFNIPFCRDDVCPSGPVPAAWWKFDEASGGIATDSSGNDNDGSIKGTYSRVAGACGDGLYFDGTSTYVLVPDDDSLDAPKYLTYAAWLKPEPPVNPYGMVHRYLNFTSLICKGSQDEDNYELFIRDLDGTSKFSFETYSGSYKEYSTTGFGYEYGQWQHVAFVADTDSGAAKLYINGEYAATVTSSLPDSFATNNNALTIGVQQMYSPYFFRYKGVMDEVILYTIALTDDQVREVYGKCTPSSGPGAPVAGFSVDTTSGNAPLTVTFTDTSANSPTSWLWNFGDGTTSTEQNPSHTYDDAGTYSVTLTTTNTGGTDTVTKTDYIDVSGVEISDFARFVVDEGVFVYGEKLEFNGDSINGPGSTVIITNDLKADKINGGASLLASNIYVGNTIDMDKGGADIGSQRNPGIIYAGNDMKLLQGSRNIYGRVHVKNNFELKDARIHNNVYVGGDLKLEHEPWIADDAYIYYVGKIDSPKNFPQSILDKCIKVDSVPEISMPEYSIPNARQASWYSSHGYDFDDGDKILSSGIKILSDGNYERKRGNSDDPRNIIIVSKDGDIKLENYNKPVSGILFAPKGKVTFKGDLFEGLVIAKDGFYVEQGGTDITFKNMDQFITNPADYPF